MDKKILDKANELFGWVSGLGGFEEAVSELVDFVLKSQADAEAIGEVSTDMSCNEFSVIAYDHYDLPVGTKIYATPRPAQVPEELKIRPYQSIDLSSANYKAGWNAFRKAMLSTAPQTQEGEA